VAVGNGPSYGGGMNIAPAASLDDGLLDVTVVGEMHRAQMLVNFPKVFKGTHISHPKVTTFRATRVELASLDTAVPMDVYADGERVGPLPATMESVPDALTVRVP
jgi:diacylglycerol kinase (ATP)